MKDVHNSISFCEFIACCLALWRGGDLFTLCFTILTSLHDPKFSYNFDYLALQETRTDGDPELLDDSEFYQQLLKEFFETVDPSSSGKNYSIWLISFYNISNAKYHFLAFRS